MTLPPFHTRVASAFAVRSRIPEEENRKFWKRMSGQFQIGCEFECGAFTNARQPDSVASSRTPLRSRGFKSLRGPGRTKSFKPKFLKGRTSKTLWRCVRDHRILNNCGLWVRRKWEQNHVILLTLIMRMRIDYEMAYQVWSTYLDVAYEYKRKVLLENLA